MNGGGRRSSNGMRGDDRPMRSSRDDMGNSRYRGGDSYSSSSRANSGASFGGRSSRDFVDDRRQSGRSQYEEKRSYDRFNDKRDSMRQERDFS